MAGERSYRHTPIVPELRRLHSPDLLDMQSLEPETPDNFCILVQAMIGPTGEQGEESFDFIVCTPKWLTESLSNHNYVLGRHHLIVARYDYNVIRDAVLFLCQTITGSTWKEVADHISRYGSWEFEDYIDSI